MLFDHIVDAWKMQVRDQIESQVTNMIVNYRDDADLQNLVDWVQQDWVRSLMCPTSMHSDLQVLVWFVAELVSDFIFC